MDFFEDRPTFIADVEDTEAYEVSLKTEHGEVVMSPDMARRIADALTQAAQDADANLEEHIADEQARTSGLDERAKITPFQPFVSPAGGDAA